MKALLRFIPGGARIVLVILLAIVLPSVLLSIFAIWAISAEREQVQERIRREAKALTTRVVEASLANLSHARMDIAAQAALLAEPGAAGGLLEKVRSAYPYFCCIVIVDERGAVLYPQVPKSQAMIDIGAVPAEISDSLQRPQNLEFVQKNLEAAAEAYANIFDTAENPRLKASALIGRARIFGKMEKWPEAVDCYRSAVNDYGSLRDDNGLLVGPGAAFRIAEIAVAPGEFFQEFVSTHKVVCNHRAEMTREEAVFLDRQLAGLAGSFLEKNTGSPAQNNSLRGILEEIDARRKREILAAAVEGAVKTGLLEGTGLESYESAGERFVLLGAPAVIAGRQLAVFAFARALEVQKKLIAPEVGKLAAREEVGVFVTDEQNGNVAGEAPAANSFRLAENDFPEPLPTLRVRAYLKGYESLRALSDIRTNIYVWAVGLAITGIVAGAVVTYVSVRRTMRAAELKSDFVSNVTHELKTPLTSIRMFAETLQEGRVKGPEDEKECLETIVTESERLSRLIDKVLDFRAIEKGKRKFDFREADLREVMLGSLQTFRRQMRGCESTVYVNIPQKLPQIRMDSDAIGEVMLNLLTNAFKYSKPEDRRIWVSAEVDEGTVRISVEDRGIGIPKRELKAVFEKFHRVDDLLTSEVDGTGLGLTISRHVAEAHGGRIELESREGTGSKFTLVLKL